MCDASHPLIDSAKAMVQTTLLEAREQARILLLQDVTELAREITEKLGALIVEGKSSPYIVIKEPPARDGLLSALREMLAPEIEISKFAIYRQRLHSSNTLHAHEWYAHFGSHHALRELLLSTTYADKSLFQHGPRPYSITREDT